MTKEKSAGVKQKFIMNRFREITPIEIDLLEKMGCSWHKDYIVRDTLIVITEEEAKAYEVAANALYEMYESAAEYVIENNLFEELDIPEFLIDEIKRSFADERGNHLYGRFDLSGGIEGREIKLIEFNADTPTMLLESTLIQWMMLQHSDIKEKRQFNGIYDAISKKFQAIASSQKGAYSKFLFSSISGVDEESVTVKLLQNMASDAGLITHFSYLEDVTIDAKHVFDAEGNSYDFWFKLYPWEAFESISSELETKFLNPAYTLLFQSKGILAILYKLFPDSKYLLPTSFEPLEQKYVKKSMFGREGANIDIVDANGELLYATDGLYAEYKSVYQEYTPFVQDAQKKYYQAGVFYSGGACGLGFRRGAEVLDDRSEFIAHLVV